MTNHTNKTPKRKKAAKKKAAPKPESKQAAYPVELAEMLNGPGWRL